MNSKKGFIVKIAVGTGVLLAAVCCVYGLSNRPAALSRQAEAPAAAYEDGERMEELPVSQGESNGPDIKKAEKPEPPRPEPKEGQEVKKAEKPEPEKAGPQEALKEGPGVHKEKKDGPEKPAPGRQPAPEKG